MTAAFLVAITMTMQGAPPKPVATLHAQGGDVRIQRGATPPVAAKRLESLRANDTIILGRDGKGLFKIEATRAVYALQPGSKIQAQTRGFKVLSGPSPKLHKQLTTFRSPDGYPPTLHTPVRAPKSDLSPSGAVRQGPVVLSWKSNPAATEVRLELLDPKSGERSWQIAGLPGSSNSYTLPADALREGQWFTARIVLRGASPTVLTAPIKALSSNERGDLGKAESELKEAFADDPISLHLELAALYAEYGLAMDMVKEVDLAYGKESESGAALRTKGIFYAQCGLAPEALATLTKAWDAGERDDAVKALIVTLGGEVKTVPMGLPSEDIESLILRRNQLMLDGKPTEALPVAQQVTALVTSESFERGDALTVMAMILADLKRQDEAFANGKTGADLLARFAQASSQGVALRFFPGVNPLLMLVG